MREARPSILPKSLQDGIYLQPSVPAPAAWRAVFLDVDSGMPAPEVRQAVSEIWTMLGELREGVVRELAGGDPGDAPVRTVPEETFDGLLGYGASFWSDAHRPPLTAAERPAHLTRLRRDGPAFPHLPWPGDRVPEASGEADLLLQFTGQSEQAVDRAAVEVWKLIEDEDLPLKIISSYDGFQRDDNRSWIGFHDGVNNVEPSQRPAVVLCPGDPKWNRGGTYLAFLRIEISLPKWRALDQAEQEVLVGREKLTGCPLESAGFEDGRLITRAIPDRPTPDSPDWRARERYFNPPETADRLIEASHTHRANQNRVAGSTRAGHRIFRQGYEYLEGFVAGDPRLGLNFVSFQNDLFHFHQILGLGDWLGDVNFGGPAAPKPGEPNPAPFLALQVGGLYAIPPRREPFPGADLFAV